MVKLEKVLLIKEQYQEGISKSQIAENMDLDWKTVNKYINMDDFNETVEDHAKSTRGSMLETTDFNQKMTTDFNQYKCHRIQPISKMQ